MPGCGQSDPAGGVKRSQGLRAAGQLGLPAGVQEAAQLADPAADFHPASRAGSRDQRLDALQGFGIRERGRNPVLLVHVLGMAQQQATCQARIVCKTAARSREHGHAAARGVQHPWSRPDANATAARCRDETSWEKMSVLSN